MRRRDMKQGERNELFIVKGFEEEVRSGVVISYISRFTRRLKETKVKVWYPTLHA